MKSSTLLQDVQFSNGETSYRALTVASVLQQITFNKKKN